MIGLHKALKPSVSSSRTYFAPAVRAMGPYWPLLAVAVAAIFTLPVAVLVFVPHPLSSQENPAARLAVSVATDQETYLPGQAVIVTVQMTNAGNAIGYVLFDSTCLASYSIRTVDGSVVYDYRAHAACGDLFTNVTLKPGEVRVFTFTWTQVSDSGIPVLAFRSYRIQGVLLSAKPSPGPSGETTIFVTSGAAGPNLAFTARTDRTTYVPGESANVSVILTNIGLETIVMHFGSPCFVQFLVVDQARHAVYNSSKWSGCIQVLTDEILAPGESRSWVFAWGLTTDAGAPLTVGQQYEVVPSFIWGDATTYQRYVSRTNVATFTVAAFTI